MTNDYYKNLAEKSICYRCGSKRKLGEKSKLCMNCLDKQHDIPVAAIGGVGEDSYYITIKTNGKFYSGTVKRIGD